MKTVIKIVAAAIVLGTYCACNSNQNREAHEVAEKDGAEVQADSKGEQDEEGEHPTGSSEQENFDDNRDPMRLLEN